MTTFMKLRVRLAALFVSLGNALSAETASAVPAATHEQATPGRAVWLESAQEATIKQPLETCARAF
jgi:hypothetical protein